MSAVGRQVKYRMWKLKSTGNNKLISANTHHSPDIKDNLEVIREAVRMMNALRARVCRRAAKRGTRKKINRRDR